jgi:hypothetical protein
VTGIELKDGDEICVAVQSNSSTKKVLSRTEKQIYQSPVVDEPVEDNPVEDNPTVTPTGEPDSMENEQQGTQSEDVTGNTEDGTQDLTGETE